MRNRLVPGLLASVMCSWAQPAAAVDPIFNQAVLHETRLVIDPSDWQALRDNFRSNDYYAANLSIDGEVVEQVGIRSRGKGSRDDVKPGLRVDFNRYGKSREFHGMTSLVLANELQDSTFLRERLCYAVFEAMGIAAPQIAQTRLTVNDEYWGLYSLVEEIRKPFVAARYGEDNGNLFKYEYDGPYDWAFWGEEPAEYVPLPFEPKTHEDDPDASGLIEFIRTINEAPDAGFVSAISAYLDVNKFLTYLAVENAVVETDGLLGDFGTNNFYLYQYAGASRLVFIPWDKDTSFSSPVLPLFDRLEQSILIRRLLSDEAARRFYVDAVVRAVHSFVNPGWLTPKLEAGYAQIRNAALDDPKKPYSNEDFELSVLGLRAVIASREEELARQLVAGAEGATSLSRPLLRGSVPKTPTPPRRNGPGPPGRRS